MTCFNFWNAGNRFITEETELHIDSSFNDSVKSCFIYECLDLFIFCFILTLTLISIWVFHWNIYSKIVTVFQIFLCTTVAVRNLSRTKFLIPASGIFLRNSIKAESKENICSAATFYCQILRVYYPSKYCVFIPDLQTYIISGICIWVSLPTQNFARRSCCYYWL